MPSGPLEKSSNILVYDMSTAQVINARSRRRSHGSVGLARSKLREVRDLSCTFPGPLRRFRGSQAAGGCVFAPYPVGEEVRTIREKGRTSCVRVSGLPFVILKFFRPTFPQAAIQTLDSFLKELCHHRHKQVVN